MNGTILIIDDDPQMLKLVEELCASLGYTVETAADGQSGLSKASKSHCSLIICDINLPRLGGFEVCRELRKANAQVPFLFLSSRAEEVDKVLGLNLGADDYVTKPFSVHELSARIRILLRRGKDMGAPPASENRTFQAGALAFDLFNHALTLYGQSIKLTPLEYDILLFLARNDGRVCTKEMLKEEVWGFIAAEYDDAIITAFSRLRRKLEIDTKRPPIIETVRGVGYRFITPELV